MNEILLKMVLSTIALTLFPDVLIDGSKRVDDE